MEQGLLPYREDHQPMIKARSTGLALATGCLALGLATLALARLNAGRFNYDSLLADLLPALSFALVAALILAYRPRHVLGWLTLLIGLLFLLEPFGSHYAAYALLARPGGLPGGELAALVSLNVWGLAYGSLVWLVLLFPTGRLLSRRWLGVGLAAAGGSLAWAAVGAAAARTYGGAALLQPELPPGAAGLQRLALACLALVTAAFLAAVVGLFLRLRRSSGIERLQLKWFVYAAALAIAVMLALFALQPYQDNDLLYQAGNMLYGLAFSAVPVAIGLAVLRYRLWDIDPLINRTLVYAGLSAAVIGLYGLIVGGLGALLRVEGSFVLSAAAAGIVAVLFEPLRTRLQRAVNRLMYGERDDPYTVLSRLGRRLESALAPEAVLPAIVEAVRDTLRLPYAAITLDQDGAVTMVAAAGTLAADPLCLPLVYQGEAIGQLILGPHAPGEEFSPAERRLLADLARQAGAAAHAVRLTADLQRLTADLQRSRERLVTAREEERRRLRRDLHDGLGPQLAGHTLKLEAAREAIRTDPDRAEALLGQLIDKSQELIAEVRRLVYALRPPALDELGLVGALREHAAQGELNGLRVSVAAPDRLPPLPAAVEVAAYRIIQEALTNVFRHARASTCRVSLALDKAAAALAVEVTDDGQGLPPEHRAGVGLVSMWERAAELGGVCRVEPGPAGGVRVTASLPLPPD